MSQRPAGHLHAGGGGGAAGIGVEVLNERHAGGRQRCAGGLGCNGGHCRSIGGRAVGHHAEGVVGQRGEAGDGVGGAGDAGGHCGRSVVDGVGGIGVLGIGPGQRGAVACYVGGNKVGDRQTAGSEIKHHIVDIDVVVTVRRAGIHCGAVEGHILAGAGIVGQIHSVALDGRGGQRGHIDGVDCHEGRGNRRVGHHTYIDN